MADAHAHMHGHDNDDVAVVHAGEVQHASRATYFWVGGILTVLTAVEVALYLLPAVQNFLIPLLLILSVVKFIIVVEFFMHLRYDQKMLSRVFFGPLCLACIVVLGMIMLFKVLPKFAW